MDTDIDIVRLAVGLSSLARLYFDKPAASECSAKHDKHVLKPPTTAQDGRLRQTPQGLSHFATVAAQLAGESEHLPCES